jgi:hypothetical protein
MKEIENKYWIKVLRTRHCKKILNVKQELLKLNSAVQQQGKKRSDNRSNKKESLIMI